MKKFIILLGLTISLKCNSLFGELPPLKVFEIRETQSASFAFGSLRTEVKKQLDVDIEIYMSSRASTIVIEPIAFKNLSPEICVQYICKNNGLEYRTVNGSFIIVEPDTFTLWLHKNNAANRLM